MIFISQKINEKGKRLDFCLEFDPYNIISCKLIDNEGAIIEYDLEAVSHRLHFDITRLIGDKLNPYSITINVFFGHHNISLIAEYEIPEDKLEKVLKGCESLIEYIHKDEDGIDPSLRFNVEMRHDEEIQLLLHILKATIQ